jgi:hypothetical protein
MYVSTSFASLFMAGTPSGWIFHSAGRCQPEPSELETFDAARGQRVDPPNEPRPVPHQGQRPGRRGIPEERLTEAREQVER